MLYYDIKEAARGDSPRLPRDDAPPGLCVLVARVVLQYSLLH